MADVTSAPASGSPLSDAELLEVSSDVANIILLARTLDVDDVAVWAEAARRSRERHDTITSILDPTAWLRDQRGIAATAKVAAAFLAFRRSIDEVRA